MPLVYYTVPLACLIWLVGYFHNGKYVRPKWKIPGKFFFYVGVSALLAAFWGWWSLIFLIGHPLLGLVFHLRVCRKHGIHWRTCEPREKYLALQEKWASGDW